MKKLIMLIIILLPYNVFAGTWCNWSGTEGTNCKTDTKGYIITAEGLPVGVSAASLNPRGWYERIITQPTLGTNQVKDAEVWSFADNQISLTWTVRDLTATEIDENTAGAMEIGQYYIWKTLLTTGVITQQQAVNNLPAELIQAYQARARLEAP